MNIIVIGCGSIGKRHIGNLVSSLDHSQIHAVDLRKDRLDEVQDKFRLPATNVHDSVESALEVCNFDGAVIATPTSFHHLDIIKMANHGANLMIEKPLSVDLDSIDEIKKALKICNKFSFVAYCFRFDPVANKFKQLLDENYLGTPLYARGEMSTYLPDWHPSEDYRDFYMSKKELGGGTLLDQSHIYDMSIWFLGEISSLFGISKKHSNLEIDTDDFGEFIFNSKSGVDISIHIDLFTKKAREFYQVTCEEGTLHWDIISRKIYAKYPNKKSVLLAEGKDYNQMYINEIQYFIEQIRNNGTLNGPSFEDGFKVMQVIEAIKASSKEGKVIHI